jgi:peptide/nickel transport system permease protein
MARFIAKRLALGLITLFLLSVLVFFMANVLPGNVGRRVLGPFASPTAVAALNHQLGTDQPVLKQYWDQMKGYLHGDMGKSVSTRQPISDVLWPALGHSAKLAALAFLIVVPLSIFGGVVAALKEGSARDRVITVGGLSATAIPDFVWAVVLLIVFSLGLGIFPSTAAWPDGSGFLTQIKYLLLPSFCLVFVLFGYIARMARAGTIEALDADYTRTAVIKGLPQRKVLWRHVLRNSLLPTIAVIATQVGYLMGGLVVIELIFNYQGIGQMIFRAATQKDFPALEAAVLVVGVVFLLSTLIADVLYSVLNPRVRLGSADS